MNRPIVHQNALYALLRAEQIEEFNRRKAAGDYQPEMLIGGDFRGLVLRNLDASGLNLSDAYFRGADLRGIDFRQTLLEGASFCQAHLSGCYFPKSLAADELRLSFELGTRVRYSV